MGKPTGFLEIEREAHHKRPVPQRVRDWLECYEPFPFVKVQDQGARCMDCGIPFCHQGCPLGNMIPDWNDLVYRKRWREALDRLHATNNFPEFTGRLCPAPCESSCVLGINADPVTIKQIEVSIIDHAWHEGWVRPEPPPAHRLTGKRVAVVGSGPAGLAAAQQLRRAGHEVTVFERADAIGGLLRYGIPEFKMEKRHLDIRLRQMEAEGVKFRTGVDVGVDLTAEALRQDFHAVLLAGGATIARDLAIPGRQLKGIHQAMHYLPMANRYALGETVERDGETFVKPTPPYDTGVELTPYVHATGKKVVIVGGGDTGADCLGTARRQGCVSVAQFEIVPEPPDERAGDNPWPQYLVTLENRSQAAHDEGVDREFQISTEEFLADDDGHVRALRTVRVEMQIENGRPRFVPVPGSEQIWEADLVLLALGFLGPEKSRLVNDLGVELDARGNVKAGENRMTSVPGVFVAGDMTRGQSLIVWAIAEGRQAAAGLDAWVMEKPSDLPRPLDDGNSERPFA